MSSAPFADIRPVVLATTDAGGAGIAAKRLDEALRRIGVPSRMACARVTDPAGGARTIPKPTRLLRRAEQAFWRLAEWKLRRSADVYWNDCFSGRADLRDLLSMDAAPLNVHWVARDVASLETFARYRGPMVVTLHDMWPFTGGCHYAGDCERWRHGCGACPALSSANRLDRSRVGAERKRKAFGKGGGVVVTPSRWLRDLAQQSYSLAATRCVAIPNALDTDRFSPGDRAQARAALGLPMDAFVVLFAADNPGDHRKGFDLFARAVEDARPALRAAGTRLLVLGRGSDQLRALGLPTDALGFVEQESELVRIYRAADALIVPSREDNFPNVVAEASACGCPTLAFRVGGIPEMVEHGRSGLLAQPFDARELGAHLTSLAGNLAWARQLGTQARAWASHTLDPVSVARAYRDEFSRVCRDER